MKLPIFDWGDLQRDAMNAQTLAAANQLEATIRSAGSSLRENYAASHRSRSITDRTNDKMPDLS